MIIMVITIITSYVEYDYYYDHYSDGGDDTDGIDNKHINYLDGNNHIIRPILYYIIIILYFQNQVIPLTCNNHA